MDVSTYKFSGIKSSELVSATNVQIRNKSKLEHTSNKSLENIFVSENQRKYSGEMLNSKNICKKALLNAKRRSKSENELNFLELNEINEFSEKTGDLIVKALKHKKHFFEKTETENDQDYNSEHCHSPSDRGSPDNMMMPMPSPPPGVVTDSQGLIVPKKLMNPCLESTDRQNLHRELLFNQKIGKNVLNQKSELQRALEKQKERQFLLQQQQQQQQERDSGLKGELNRVIMERQQKIEKKNLHQDEIDSQLNPEYLNARAKLRTRIDAK